MKIDKESVVYKKYAAKYDPDNPENKKRKRAMQKNKMFNWISKNWIALGSLIVAIIALVVTLLK